MGEMGLSRVCGGTTICAGGHYIPQRIDQWSCGHTRARLRNLIYSCRPIRFHFSDFTPKLSHHRFAVNAGLFVTAILSGSARWKTVLQCEWDWGGGGLFYGREHELLESCVIFERHEFSFLN